MRRELWQESAAVLTEELGAQREHFNGTSSPFRRRWLILAVRSGVAETAAMDINETSKASSLHLRALSFAFPPVVQFSEPNNESTRVS